MSKEVSDSFVASLTNDDYNIIELLLAAFKFAEGKEDLQGLVEGASKIVNIRALVERAICTIYAHQDDVKDRYLVFVAEVFTDSYDLGMIISVIMKTVDEISAVKNMTGAEKKAKANEVFEAIIAISPLEAHQKQLANFAFDGVVEAIIWAKHGGLKKVKKGCKKYLCCK